jgi:hypothetical protein
MGPPSGVGQRGVDQVDPGDKLFDVGILDHQPVVAVGVFRLAEPARVIHGQELDHFRLHVLEPLSGRRLETDSCMSGARHSGSTLEGDRSGRQREQRVQVRLDRLAPTEQGGEQPHQ